MILFIFPLLPSTCFARVTGNPCDLLPSNGLEYVSKINLSEPLLENDVCYFVLKGAIGKANKHRDVADGRLYQFDISIARNICKTVNNATLPIIRNREENEFLQKVDFCNADGFDFQLIALGLTQVIFIILICRCLLSLFLNSVS